ncbi:MAG TPA: DmsC/YnfH family molybdoenzyme membrane anchor subunit [Symbiobacteriaceae bacterium]
MPSSRSELALIVFSLFAQLALGALTVAAVFAMRFNQVPAEAARLVALLLDGAVPCLALGLLVSLAHLGSPAGAYRALRNLADSWLSREILCSLLFGALALATGWLHWTGKGSPALLWAAVVSGAAAVWAMSSIYTHSVNPAWTTFFTPISFFTAALMLGTAVGTVVLVYATQRGEVAVTTFRAGVQDLQLTAALALAAQLISLPLYVEALHEGPAAARAALSRLWSAYGALLILRLIMGAVGVAALFYGWTLAGRTGSRPMDMSAFMFYAAAVVLVLAEVIARVVFYAMGISTLVGWTPPAAERVLTRTGLRKRKSP